MKAIKITDLVQWLLIGGIIIFFIIPVITLITAGLFEGQPLQGAARILWQSGWLAGFLNSVIHAGIAAALATITAWLLAYGMHFSRLFQPIRQFSDLLFRLPMLLPTITYGFVLLYCFGKQGLWTRILGFELFDLYGSSGVILGYFIYTLPTAYLLLYNGMDYLDQQYLVVSRLLGDSPITSVLQNVLRPMQKLIGISFCQTFFMAFTDFGIPTAVGGRKVFITTLLYEGFTGSIPDFQKGSLVALSMLIPSLFSVLLIRQLQKLQQSFKQRRKVPVVANLARDSFLGLLFVLVGGSLLAMFSVMFIIPFVTAWPYEMIFTTENFRTFFADDLLSNTLSNSLIVSLISAVVGMSIAYLAGIVTSFSRQNSIVAKGIDLFATLTNSFPGMVLGVMFLLAFSGTTLHNTLSILVIANIIHFFATPYQMAKESFQKMDHSWEKTSQIMGDRWIDLVWRIIIPNSRGTILEMMSYYFTNSMVTISGLIFLVSARTSVMTTKIKELQHFGRFVDIFILSLLILAINCVALFAIKLTKKYWGKKKEVTLNQKQFHFPQILFKREMQKFSSK